MKGLVKVAPRENAVEWTDWEDPVAGPGEVVIEVAAAGICGTDLSIYKWPEELVQLYKWPSPLLLGHEFSGRVAAVGAGVEGLAIGDLVSANPIHACGHCFYCRRGMSEICDDRPQVGLDLPGAFAPYTKVRAQNVIRIPEGVPLDVAALCEPLAVAVHAMERVRLEAGDSVAVVGAGPIGLLLALAAMANGASEVFVTGLSRDAGRLRIAEAIGARPVNAETDDPGRPVRAATQGRGADVVFEAGGHPTAVLQAFSLARKGARIGIVGLPHHPTSLSTSAMAVREKELIGCRAYTQKTWSQVQQLLPGVKEQLALMITHRLPMENGAEGIRMALRGEGAKILLTP